jgi:putative phage-type endonuclease
MNTESTDVVNFDKGGKDSARDAWLRERLTGIGSSDAAAVAGQSPWRTPVDVWLEKTQRIAAREDEDTGPTYWGKRLEALVIEEYRNKTGAAIGHQQHLVRHKQYPFMIATLDAIAIHPSGGPRPLEAKTTRWAREWGEPETDEVPPYYVFQVQHQLAVTGYAVADIAVLIGGSDFRIYQVQRDEGIIDALIKVETEFWQSVIDRVPPPIRSQSDAARLFPSHVPGSFMDCDEDTYNAWCRLRDARDAMRAANEQVEQLSAQLQGFMGNAEMLTLQGDVLATWRKTAPIRRVDSKKLQREHPVIYAACLKPNEGERRFLFKGE